MTFDNTAATEQQTQGEQAGAQQNPQEQTQQQQGQQGQEQQQQQQQEQQPSTFSEEMGGSEGEKVYPQQRTNDYQAGIRVTEKKYSEQMNALNQKVTSLEGIIAQSQTQTQAQTQNQIQNPSQTPSSHPIVQDNVASEIADIKYTQNRQIKVDEFIGKNQNYAPLRAEVIALSQNPAYKDVPTNDLFSLIASRSQGVALNDQNQELPAVNPVTAQTVQASGSAQPIDAQQAQEQVLNKINDQRQKSGAQAFQNLRKPTM